MTKVLLYTFCILSLVACNEIPKATNAELDKAISQHPFDQKYIDNINECTDMQEFVDNNLDTLMNYLNSNYKVIKAGNDSFDTIIEPQNCHCFSRNTSTDINSAPLFLQKDLEYKWKKLGYITKISFCDDGEIGFVVKHEDIQDGVFAVHSLIWHETINPNHKLYPREKSLKINEEWTYRIGIVEDYGW